MMSKVLYSLSFAVLLIFAGCAKEGAVRYEGDSYKSIKHIMEGEVLKTRDVYVADTGTGATIGTIIGAIAGSTVGSGKGRTLSSLGGAIIGGVAGSEVNTKNAQELTVRLDSNETIVAVSVGTSLNVGDRVRIVKDDNEVASVYKIEE